MNSDSKIFIVNGQGLSTFGFIHERMTTSGIPHRLMSGLGYIGIAIPIEHAPGNEGLEALLVMGKLQPKVLDSWISPPDGNATLEVVLEPADEQAAPMRGTMNEEAFLAAMSTALPGYEERRRDFAIAILQDGDGFHPFDRIGRDYHFSEIRPTPAAWSLDEEVKWYPGSWDPAEPMVEVVFSPLAELADGTLVPVHVHGLDRGWHFPLRLIPDGIDIDDPVSRRQLVSLPATPAEAKAWSELAPFRIRIDNPEIFASADPLDAIEP